MLVESARITRGTKDLMDISRLRVDSYQALIIPSFISPYNNQALKDVHNIAAVRSAISEFNIKKKLLVPIGPSAINLVGKSLGVNLRSNPSNPNKLESYQMQYMDTHKILSLPYN